MAERLLFISKPATNRKTATALENHGYEVLHASSLRHSLRAVAEFQPHMLIIDTNDTTVNNMRRVVNAANTQASYPFVILLVNHHQNVPGDVDHDAYLTRPFTAQGLERKVRELLNSRRDYVLAVEPLMLDRRTHLTRTPRGVVRLTLKQFQLLECLMQRPGELVTRRELMQQVWNTDYLGDTRTLDVHIRWLRESIEETPDHPHFIQTDRGRGYILTLAGPPRVGGEPITMVELQTTNQ